MTATVLPLSLIDILWAPDWQEALAGSWRRTNNMVPGRLDDDMVLLLTEPLPVGVDLEYTYA